MLALTTGPEVRAQALFADRYMGVIHARHLLARDAVTSADYTAFGHVVACRQGLDLRGVYLLLLAAAGLKRDVFASVDGFVALGSGLETGAMLDFEIDSKLRGCDVVKLHGFSRC